ncbi:MAG: hypothetical protein AAGU04_02115 [Anaerolineaceae bacterium]
MLPFFFAVASFFEIRQFNVYYLIPAPLAPEAFLGGLLLLAACLLAKKERKFILWSFGLAVFFLVLSQLLAIFLVLADGWVGEGTWQMYLVVVMLVLYWVFLALLEVGAFRLGSALRTPAEEILT